MERYNFLDFTFKFEWVYIDYAQRSIIWSTNYKPLWVCSVVLAGTSKISDGVSFDNKYFVKSPFPKVLKVKREPL